MEVDIPVVFMTFNRPSQAGQVLESIRRFGPSKLYFVSDGPRKGVEDDQFLVSRVRALRYEIDWPCQVIEIFADENLGLRQRFFSALDHVFETEPCAIVLEDDCLPSKSFFSFAEAGLRGYSGDVKIGSVSGTNHLGAYSPHSNQAFFGTHPHIWGWATWQREWNAFRQSGLREAMPIRVQLRALLSIESLPGKIFFLNLLLLRRKLSTWDIDFAVFERINQKLSLAPPLNLVENTGLGTVGSTHGTTFGSVDRVRAFDPGQIGLPPAVVPDSSYHRKMSWDRARKVLRSLLSKNPSKVIQGGSDY